MRKTRDSDDLFDTRWEASDWIECPSCEGVWCVIHEEHAFECACEPPSVSNVDEKLRLLC